PSASQQDGPLFNYLVVPNNLAGSATPGRADHPHSIGNNPVKLRHLTAVRSPRLKAASSNLQALVAVNSGCRLCNGSRDQTFHVSSSWLRAMKLDHFPGTDDFCIWNGKKRHTLGEKHGRKDRRERGQVPGHAQDEPWLVADPAEHSGSPPVPPPVRSDGRGVRLRQGIQEPRPEGRDQGPACLDDTVAGVVAGRLWPLRRTDDPPNEIEIA